MSKVRPRPPRWWRPNHVLVGLYCVPTKMYKLLLRPSNIFRTWWERGWVWRGITDCRGNRAQLSTSLQLDTASLHSALTNRPTDRRSFSPTQEIPTIAISRHLLLCTQSYLIVGELLLQADLLRYVTSNSCTAKAYLQTTPEIRMFNPNHIYINKMSKFLATQCQMTFFDRQR